MRYLHKLVWLALFVGASLPASAGVASNSSPVSNIADYIVPEKILSNVLADGIDNIWRLQLNKTSYMISLDKQYPGTINTFIAAARSAGVRENHKRLALRREEALTFLSASFNARQLSSLSDIIGPLLTVMNNESVQFGSGNNASTANARSSLDAAAFKSAKNEYRRRLSVYIKTTEGQRTLPIFAKFRSAMEEKLSNQDNDAIFKVAGDAGKRATNEFLKAQGEANLPFVDLTDRR